MTSGGNLMENYKEEFVLRLNRILDENSEYGKYFSPIEVNEFIDWQLQEIEYFMNKDKDSKVNLEILPQKFNVDRIKGKVSDEQYRFIMKFYKKSESENVYVLDESVKMSSAEYDFFCENYIFVRGCVVFVNFGFSIGNEIGEVRPALILGNAGPGELYVLPLSNKVVSEDDPRYVKFDIFCSLSKTWGVAHIDDLKRISVKRIVTTLFSGGIDTCTLKSVRDRIVDYYLDFFHSK